MDPALLVQLGQLLLTIGPAFASEVAAIRSAGTATPQQLAALEGQVSTMDGQRMASWSAADAALTAAGA